MISEMGLGLFHYKNRRGGGNGLLVWGGQITLSEGGTGNPCFWPGGKNSKLLS